jgi:hypothetical protein
MNEATAAAVGRATASVAADGALAVITPAALLVAATADVTA